jgi:formylglycine-generating enzyme required for sulfatase activity
MICKNCNTLNSNDAKVCVNCGQKLGSLAAPVKTEKKPSVTQPATNRFASTPKQAAAKTNPSGGGAKKSHTGLLLVILILAIAGAGYFLVNTDEGKKYVDDLKENETFGKYISMVDSLIKPYLTEYVPSMKAEEEARLKAIEDKKSAEEEAKKKKAALRKASEEDTKPTIKRVKRNMQYYRALKDNMNMVLIPAGNVMIGSDSESQNERPIHEVYVKAFYIDEHEVTNSQFRIFVEETGYKLPKHILFDQFNGPNQPIVGASYQDAEAYAKWAGKRLPTEYEWEKAARGGLEGLKYPYTNDMDPKIACYDLNPVNDGPADVKSYEANDFKLYDMDGNVAEWTTSVAAPYPGGRLIKEYGSDYQVIRGGSWKDIKSNLTVSIRDFKGRNWSGNNVGFRCVMDY